MSKDQVLQYGYLKFALTYWNFIMIVHNMWKSKPVMSFIELMVSNIRGQLKEPFTSSQTQ